MTVLRRLNSISSLDDSITNETKHHQRCWVDMKRAAQQKDGSIYTQEIHDTHYVVADIEIINFVKQDLEDSTRKVLTTNIVEKVYQEILVDNGLNQEYQQKSHKKYLKQLIIENIDDVKFIKSPCDNEPGKIHSKSAGDHSLDMTMQQCAAQNCNDIFNAAKIIRHELETMAKWSFQGSFSNSSSLVQLSTFLRQIIFGPLNAPENKARQRFIKKTCYYTDCNSIFYEQASSNI